MSSVIDQIIVELDDLCKNPHMLRARIPILQKLIWSSLVDENIFPAWSILYDLAYDLDCYEPDARERQNDDSLMDEARVVGEIQKSLEQIRKVGCHKQL